MDTIGLVMSVIIILSVFGYLYLYVISEWLQYRRARKEIFAFVKSHKKRCTGNNRFVVTVETLQDSFRTYNSNIILNVWLELVEEHVIMIDPQDQEWCVR